MAFLGGVLLTIVVGVVAAVFKTWGQDFKIKSGNSSGPKKGIIINSKEFARTLPRPPHSKGAPERPKVFRDSSSFKIHSRSIKSFVRWGGVSGPQAGIHSVIY